ncbi:MAG: TonB family protein [Bacteroidales bacterium]
MKTTLTSLLFVLSFCSGISAQTNDEQARQKYIQAKEAFENGKYNYALSNLLDAKLLLGKTNARIQPYFVKCYAKMGRWYSAKLAIKNYYALNPDKNLVDYAEIVELEKEADKHLTQQEVDQINAQLANPSQKTKSAIKTTSGGRVKSKEDRHSIVEEMPQFPGGEGCLTKFLNENLQYPPVSQECGIQGTVNVRFLVLKDGTIGDVEVVKSLDKACDKEVIRLVKCMPKWSPGKQNGVVVPVWYSLPVSFHLD